MMLLEKSRKRQSVFSTQDCVFDFQVVYRPLVHLAGSLKIMKDH